MKSVFSLHRVVYLCNLELDGLYFYFAVVFFPPIFFGVILRRVALNWGSFGGAFSFRAPGNALWTRTLL